MSFFRHLFPSAHDRDDPSTGPPSSDVLGSLARFLEELMEDGGSSPDEGAPPANAGRRGNGILLTVGTSHTARELCDGQTLASPGRWPTSQRTD